MEKAYILVSCEIGTEQELALKLEEIDEAKHVMITYGDYDIVIEAETDDAAKMDDVITSKVRKLEKIRSTITLRVTI
jgi:DNA-binding Lrp family transcriptional regulator